MLFRPHRQPVQQFGDVTAHAAVIDIAGPAAELHRARIDHGDLTALLYIQGYRRDEFVDD